MSQQAGAINRAPTSSPDKSGNCREYFVCFSFDDEYAIFDCIYLISILSSNLLLVTVEARFIAPRRRPP
jgi:hypothetical protein